MIAASLAIDRLGLSGQGCGEEQRFLVFLGFVMILAGTYVGYRGRAPRTNYASEALISLPLFLVCVFTVNGGFLGEMTLAAPPYHMDFNRGNVDRSIALLQLTTPQASVGVLGAGAIPFYTDRHAYDFLGKVDPYIADLPPDLSGAISWGRMLCWPGHAKYDLMHSIEKLRPTYVQELHWGRQDLRGLLGSEYVTVFYQGIELILLRGSPYVDWERAESDS